MLVGTTDTERVDIPHESGQWMEFKLLSGRELDEAEQAQTKRFLRMVAGMDAGTLDAMRKMSGSPAADARPDTYDKEKLVEHGVVAWSYDEPCTAAKKALLDARTRDWAAAAIIERNTRTEGEGPGSGSLLEKARSLGNSETPIVSTPLESLST
jgi:hypothetical protein